MIGLCLFISFLKKEYIRNRRFLEKEMLCLSSFLGIWLLIWERFLGCRKVAENRSVSVLLNDYGFGVVCACWFGNNCIGNTKNTRMSQLIR